MRASRRSTVGCVSGITSWIVARGPSVGQGVDRGESPAEVDEAHAREDGGHGESPDAERAPAFLGANERRARFAPRPVVALRRRQVLQGSEKDVFFFAHAMPPRASTFCMCAAS